MTETLTQIHPNVWRLVGPGIPPFAGPINTYFVGTEQVVIIDPGPDDTGHLENILASLNTLGATVQAIIPTHPHPDHDGCATRLAGQLGVPLLQFGDPLHHGNTLNVNGSTLAVHHTPGHIYKHICLWLVEQRLLFAGDLVSGEGTVLIIPPDGNMADYLDSLAAMQALEPLAILPGHGPQVDMPQVVLQHYINHRLQREQEVLDQLAEGYVTAEEIAARIYADRPEVLPVATLQVEAHLQKLRKEGKTQ